MKKVLNIAWKDVLVVLRDPGALVMMLVTPFALTLAIAFAFGGLTGGGVGGTGLEHIPVAIVNNDSGQIGQSLVQLFQSPDLGNLVAPTLLQDDGAAEAEVDAGRAAAAVLIPADLSARVMPSGLALGNLEGVGARKQAVIVIYSNPTAPISAGVVRGVVDRFLSQVAAGAAAAEVSIGQLVANGILTPPQAMAQGQVIAQEAVQRAVNANLIGLRTQSSAAGTVGGFDWLTYMAPSMAILFLMFTVSAGGRSILAERDEGTLPRMLVTPTSAAHVLGGKVAGIFGTGLAQMAILIVASGLLFGVRWGDPLAVALLTLALVAAATGWGMLIAALARTPGQANAVGTALALIFGAAAGNFVPRQLLPGWLKTISSVSPNAWGLDGFTSLTAGGTLADVYTYILALVVMGALLFGVATLAFRRQYV